MSPFYKHLWRLIDNFRILYSFQGIHDINLKQRLPFPKILFHETSAPRIYLSENRKR